jgi:spermidine synthase
VRSTGLLTLANTTGAMLGSLAGGFVLLPGLGIERSIRVIAGLYAATGLLLAAVGLWPSRRTGRAAWFFAAAACAAVLGPLFPAGLMERRYLTFPLRAFTAGGERAVAVRESLTETILYTRRDVLGEPAYYRLVTNTHSMSTTSFKAQRYMRLFVYLPIALHPAPKDALLISYGVGVTAKALTDTRELGRIDVVDVSRDILEMNRIAWEPSQYPLDDPRVYVHIEDGRQFLQATDRTFDVITGEPPPPKAAGIVSLYTKEFFSLARARLRPGGILSYWLPVHLFSEEETRSILRSFCDVFSDCSLWSGGGLDWILIGTNGASGPGSAERFAAQWRDPVVAAAMRDLGFELPAQLGATFMGDGHDLEAIAAGALPLDDDHPKRLGQAMLDPQEQNALYRSWLDPARLAERFTRSPWIRRMWPDDVRAETLPFFGVQDRIEDFFATGLGQPAQPAEDLPRVDRVLRETPLETLALWEMRLNRDVQHAIQRAAAKGARQSAVDFEAGARALAGRRFDEAASRFGAAREAGSADRLPLYYQLYALCRAGRKEEGRMLATQTGVAEGGDPTDRGVWSFLRAACGPAPGAPLGSEPAG